MENNNNIKITDIPTTDLKCNGYNLFVQIEKLKNTLQLYTGELNNIIREL